MSFELAQHATSRDPILTALAQNGLLRLQCDKATIWSVDGLSQHVVAEASPLSALCSPQKPSSQETSLNQLIKESLLVFTAPIPPTDDTSDTIVNHTRHVIRDVRGRESPKTTSFVMTSYAAVPILGTCGQLLGCYCVADEDIRDDFFADQTYTILGDVACAISRYLGQQATASSRPRGRCDRPTSILNDASSLSPESSERSLFTGSSCDDTTPLTTPNEAPEFTFDLPMPAKPDPSHTSTINATEEASATIGQAVKSDFVSSLSHELRSPLHGCLAAAELLRETKLDATQTDLVTMKHRLTEGKFWIPQEFYAIAQSVSSHPPKNQTAIQTLDVRLLCTPDVEADIYVAEASNFAIALVRALYAALDRPDDLVSSTPPAAAANTLPGYMDIDPVEPQPEDLPSAKAEDTCTTSTEQHLLLVDDNAINLKLLSTFVKKLNFNAATAIDGQDALTKYKSWSKRHAFTTILMDISMPKMNGFESSRAIREFEVENGLQPAKIIALTALSSEASRREAEASGIDDFQMKPVSLKTLKGLFPEAAASA
ncbi:hypothetical protein D6C81_10666 [Aureobasidium pullulans]|nr:hypothetical protein D6C81_10666 [Aureobasidium pullulans]